MRVLIGFFVLVFSTVLTLDCSSQTTRAKTINTGYVFIDGVKIKPPYKLVLEDDNLRINDHVVWLDEDNIYHTNYPSVVKTSTDFFDNKKTNGFSSKMFRFYYKNYNKQQADKLIREYITKLPFVEKTYFSERGSFVVVGESMHMPWYWIIDERPYKKGISKKYKKKYSYLNKRITAGDSVFIFNQVQKSFKDKEEYKFFSARIKELISNPEITKQKIQDKLIQEGLLNPPVQIPSR